MDNNFRTALRIIQKNKIHVYFYVKKIRFEMFRQKIMQICRKSQNVLKT